MSHAILKRRDWFQANGFPIAIERREPQEPFGLHSHEFSEIVIITSGLGVHVTGKESYPLNAGNVFVIGGSRQHDYHSMERLCLINILFQPDKLYLRKYDLQTLPGYHALFTLESTWRRRNPFQSRLHLTQRELNTLMAFVDQLEEELQARKVGFKFMAMASFMHIVGFLSRCFARIKNPDSRALLRIGEAISHLEANYREPVVLEQLASIANMSKRNFMRCFLAATGTSPIAHVIQLRLNQAASLLRRTDDSVTEIAFQTGFSDSNYFTRQFRAQLGMTPSQYRRHNGMAPDRSP